MIKPVSFGSTYLIKNRNEENTFERQVANDELKNLCKKRRIPYNEKAFHNEFCEFDKAVELPAKIVDFEV